MSITVTSLLWSDPQRAGEDLEERLRMARVSSDTLAKAPTPVSAGLHPVLDSRISEVLRGAVEGVDLGGVLVKAWAGWRALRKAAEDTAAGGPPIDVDLAEHEIAHTSYPVVDVQVNGSSVHQITFDLVLSLLVRSVIAVVDGGRLVAVRGGQVAIEARLELNGTVLASSGKHTCLPGILVELGGGIDLVATAAGPTPPSSSVPTWVDHGSPAPTPSATPHATPVPAPATTPWWERTSPPVPVTPAWWQSGDRQP